jgi:enoyl-CoA hydratase
MNTAKYSTLTVEKKEQVCILTINRPDALNALNTVTLTELTEAIDDLEKDLSITVVILTGAGRAFVAGADIKEMTEMTPLEAKEFSAKGHTLARKMEKSRLPFIAAVNGHALGGGCELMMACDFAIAAKQAKIGQPEINLGVIPGFGGTQRLPRLVGPARAKELLYTGKIIDAAEAHTLGLVNRVTEDSQLLTEALKIASVIASKSPLTISWLKQMVTEGMMIDLETACSLEKTVFSLCFSTHDQKEGMKAFLEKRPPGFKGA